MNITHHIHHDRHERIVNRHAYFYLALRIATGLLLLLKGIYFISHSQSLETMVQQANTGWGVNFFVSYITFAHLFGGVFIMLGLLTRFAIVLQLPIIVAAIYYNIAPNAFGTGAELMLSVLILVMLVYLLRNGSGPISMDDYIQKKAL